MRMARSVSSSSATRACRPLTSFEAWPACLFLLGTYLLLIRLDIQPEYYAILIGKIADQPPQRQWHGLNQGRRGNDLARRSHCWLLIDVDNFQVKLTGNIFVAQRAKIFDRLARARSLSGDIQPESVARDRPLRCSTTRSFCGGFCLRFPAAFSLGFHTASILFRLRTDVETHQDPLGVRKVTDNFANRLRKIAHQRRNGKYLVILGQLRGLDQVDQMQPGTALQMFLTDFFQILKGDQRFWCLTRDIQAKLEHNLGSVPGGLCLGRFCFHLGAPHEFTTWLSRVTPRILLISSRSRANLCWRSLRCRERRANSDSPEDNSERNAAICDSRALRLTENSLRFSSSCCCSRSDSARSRASCARRADPVKTVPNPTYAESKRTPVRLRTNSRIWLECAMPRDFKTYRQRLRSPFSSRSRSRIQVSVSEEMPTSVCSSAPRLAVSVVNMAVIWRSFKKSNRRISMAWTSLRLALMRLVMGSTMTT